MLLYVANMKLKDDFALFGNAKDLESEEIFEFILLFAKYFIHKRKMENKRSLFDVFKKATDNKA